MLEILLTGRNGDPPWDPLDLNLNETTMMVINFTSLTNKSETLNFISQNLSYRIVDQSGRTITTFTQSSSQATPVTRAVTVPTGVSWLKVHSTPYEPAGVGPLNPAFSFRIEAQSASPGNTTIAGISDWDNAQVRKIGFSYLHNLKTCPAAIPRQLTSLSFFMFGSNGFNSSDINTWNTRNIKDFSRAFSSCTAFNQPMAAWDTSNGENFNAMFSGSSNFAGDPKLWNMEKAVDTGLMFYTTKLNSDISKWSTGNVEIMSNMFNACALFNQDLSKWNVGKVTNYSGYDAGATAWLPQYKPKFTT